jgi:carbonic anhydrase/acetyltransferase-like protein (isoleucine patch superfamily)
MVNIRNFKTNRPTLGERIYIDPQATVIGNVNLGHDVSVWPMAVLRGDVNFISIGDGCNIQDGAVLHVTHDGPFTPGGQPLVLAKGITIGHKAILHACEIEDYCLIGINAVILDKVYIEHHVMVAAGSLVPPGKRLQSGYLYLGNPARAVRPLNKEEINHLEYSAKHYIKLKNQYLEARGGS